MSRNKTTLPESINTAQDADRVLGEYAEAQSRLQKLKAEMELQLTDIRKSYEDRFSPLVEESDKKYEQLLAYALVNSDNFKNRKSMVLTHGTIGFRTGTPKLKTRKGFTWAAVFELVKDKLPMYLRKKEEVNKEALIIDREKLGEKLKEIGVEVDQEESFYIESKIESIPAV